MEQPLDTSGIVSDPASTHALLARRLLIDENFHPSVVIAELKRNGCNEEAASAIVDALCESHPPTRRRATASKAFTVLLWIVAGGAIAFVVYIIALVVMFAMIAHD